MLIWVIESFWKMGRCLDSSQDSSLIIGSTNRKRRFLGDHVGQSDGVILVLDISFNQSIISPIFFNRRGIVAVVVGVVGNHGKAMISSVVVEASGCILVLVIIRGCSIMTASGSGSSRVISIAIPISIHVVPIGIRIRKMVTHPDDLF
jgi:hypothetical protein